MPQYNHHQYCTVSTIIRPVKAVLCYNVFIRKKLTLKNILLLFFKIISDMESQIHSLREELIQVNTQRKQQLVELGLLRDEEKQKAALDREAAVNKLKADSEKMILELKKTHAAETEMALEKVSTKTQLQTQDMGISFIIVLVNLSL